MAGNSSIESNQTVTFTDNLSFDGTDRGGAMVADGQLWIGSGTANRPNDGGHVRLGSLTSLDGSIAILNGQGTINLTGQAAPFVPNAVLQEFDDFLEPIGAGGKLAWTSIFGSNAQFATNGTGDHPGIISIQPGTAGDSCGIALNKRGSGGINNVGNFVLGSGTLTCNWVIQLSALSAGGNTYRFSCGLADATTILAGTDSFVNGVYFQYTDSVNSGNWQIKNTSASVTTTANTSTAANTSFVTLSVVVNAAGTSVAYYINGNQVANSPITTNIPSATITPFFVAVNTAGTTPQLNADLWWGTQALSNPRPGPTPGTPPADNRIIGQYTATATNYQVLGTDAIIGVTSTAAPRTITMPLTPTTGQIWTIKDESGGAAANNITVSGNGRNIDGSSTFIINTNYGSIEVYFNGVNFFVI